MYTAKCLVGPSRPVLEYIGILRNTHTHTENHFKCIVLLLPLHVSINLGHVFMSVHTRQSFERAAEYFLVSKLMIDSATPQAVATVTSFPLLHLLLQNQQAEGGQNLVLFFFFNCSIVDVQYYVSFRCITW